MCIINSLIILRLNYNCRCSYNNVGTLSALVRAIRFRVKRFVTFIAWTAIATSISIKNMILLGDLEKRT